MTHIPAVEMNKLVSAKPANYNAVKIQINNPVTNIPEGFNNSDNNGIYNGVSIEVNKPELNIGKEKVYNYPISESPVTADFAGIYPMPKMPVLPVAYQTTNFIHNKTLVAAEFDTKKDLNLDTEKTQEVLEKVSEEAPDAEIVVIEEFSAVPRPNLTTVENEKHNIKEFNLGKINFKGNNVDVVSPVDIKPNVSIQQVVSKLASENFDVQALQMEEIAKIAMENPENAIPYINTEIFTKLINIIELDSSSLTPPSEKQMEIRKQIIVNEIVKEQAIENKQDLKDIELPYQLDEKDIQDAVQLSPMEQSERNKEYALYTMSILAKVYTEDVKKITGNVVPLTDLPGATEIVNTLKNSQNPGVKVAAIDALRYLNQPEYKDELISILTIVTRDENPYVAKNAELALESLK